MKLKEFNCINSFVDWGVIFLKNIFLEKIFKGISVFEYKYFLWCVLLFFKVFKILKYMYNGIYLI